MKLSDAVADLVSALGILPFPPDFKIVTKVLMGLLSGDGHEPDYLPEVAERLLRTCDRFPAPKEILEVAERVRDSHYTQVGVPVLEGGVEKVCMVRVRVKDSPELKERAVAKALVSRGLSKVSPALPVVKDRRREIDWDGLAKAKEMPS